jgi:hypothetical protein
MTAQRTTTIDHLTFHILPSTLDDNLCLLVFLAEFRGVAAFALAEQAIEVGEGVETCGPAYLGDTIRGVYQPTGGMAQANVDDVF